MPCYHLYQSLYTYVQQPGTTWWSDYALEPPYLVYPAQDENVCPPGADPQVVLRWSAVAGASFYVVQWCANSSFYGPTLRAARVATNEHPLAVGDDVRLGETIFWRVMAYNENGGVSFKSQTWQFQYECPNVRWPLRNVDGGHALAGALEKCEQFGVKMQVGGPDHAMCCDRLMFHNKSTWSCKDEDGNERVQWLSQQWTIRQNPAEAVGAVIEGADNGDVVIVVCECEASQVVIVRLTATFRWVPTAEEFTCFAEKRFRVDCHVGFAYSKPWLESPDPYGVPAHTHVLTEYHDSPLGCMDPLIADGKSIVDDSTRIAVGPVFQVALVQEPQDEGADPCGLRAGSSAYAYGMALEARVPIPYDPIECEDIPLLGPCCCQDGYPLGMEDDPIPRIGGLTCDEGGYLIIDPYICQYFDLNVVTEEQVQLTLVGNRLRLTMGGTMYKFGRNCENILRFIETDDWLVIRDVTLGECEEVVVDAYFDYDACEFHEETDYFYLLPC